MFSYRYVSSKHLFLFIGCAPSFGISGVSAFDNMKPVTAPMTMTVKRSVCPPKSSKESNSRDDLQRSEENRI
jgi:hypothetical protein